MKSNQQYTMDKRVGTTVKPPKDLKYPGNSLYYSGPSKMIETHVTNKRDMKDDDWVTLYHLVPDRDSRL